MAPAEAKAGFVDAEAKKHDWMERKRAYLAHLAEAPNDVLLVSACDKLHNARAILADLEDPLVREAVFDRFTGGRDGTLQYYESLQRSFGYRCVGIATQLETAVARMHRIVGAPRRPLPIR